MTSKVYFFILFFLVAGQLFAQDQKSMPAKKFTFSIESGIEANNIGDNHYDGTFIYPGVSEPIIYGGNSLVTAFKASYALSSRWRIDALAGLTPQRITFSLENRFSYRLRNPREQVSMYADLGSGISYQQPLFWKVKLAPFVRTGYLISFVPERASSSPYFSTGMDLMIGKFYISGSVRLSFKDADAHYPTDMIDPRDTVSNYTYDAYQTRILIGYRF